MQPIQKVTLMTGHAVYTSSHMPAVRAANTPKRPTYLLRPKAEVLQHLCSNVLHSVGLQVILETNTTPRTLHSTALCQVTLVVHHSTVVGMLYQEQDSLANTHRLLYCRLLGVWLSSCTHRDIDKAHIEAELAMSQLPAGTIYPFICCLTYWL